jgi:alpha-tubulin suppressor-like RCC1 family protein
VTSLFAAASVSVADDHSCALDTMGAAYCWGANDAGQLGTGRFDAVPRTNPVKVSTGNTFVSLAAGHKYTCGLTDTGKAFCWGMNDVAQLGSAVAGVSTPVPVSVAGGHAFTALAAGRRHACGLTTDGVAFCWGDGSFGLTGNAVPGIRTIPIRVPIARRLTALSAGSDFTCALSDGGDVFCWGRDDQRQLGSVSTETCVLGDTEDDFGETVTVTGQCSYTPVRVATSHTVVSLVSAPAESCGVTADALLVCWGNGFIAPRVTEGIPLDGTVVLGMGVVCGLDGGGALRCRDFAQGAAALVLGNALSFKRLTGSASHFCGVVRGDPSIAYCWGVNEFGQLGDGTTQRRGLPVPVASPVPGVRE